MKRYTIGIDFGTLSARAVALDTATGQEAAGAEFIYPHGVMDRQLPDGQQLPPMFALQHPRDYLDALQALCGQILQKIPKEQILGLGIDFTTSTVLPVDEKGEPLCFSAAFAGQPHAYAKLWKHHGPVKQAEKMTQVARAQNAPWLDGCGGTVSSEWLFPKILETLEEAPAVFDATYRFYEAADWLCLMLTGQEVHNPCMAALKGCWSAEHGYPSAEYFRAVDPRLENIVGTKVSCKVDRVDEPAGKLSKEGAFLTGLEEGTVVAMPIGDAHGAMPALNITKPGQAMAVIGTSGVVMVNTEKPLAVPGICALTYGGVFPGICTMEAGQAALGDSFDWFVKTFGLSHKELTEKASRLKPGQSRLVALDWWSGNRSILKNDGLSGMLLGLNLQTRPEEIYRALIESTAYGLRVIVENYEENGVAIGDICAAGGIALKNPMLMQIYADVLGRTITVSGCTQAGARGSALYAAVAGGVFPDIWQAAEICKLPAVATYQPKEENVQIYHKLFSEYRKLHDYFGKENPVMDHLCREIGV